MSNRQINYLQTTNVFNNLARMKNFKKQFGGKITKALEARYAKSANWKDGKFQNLVETKMDLSFWDLPNLLYKQFIKKKGRTPKQPLPIVPFDKKAFLADDVPFKFVWYGHSVVLIRMHGKTILIDPMLGPDAGPIAPNTIGRFSENTLDLIDDFPEIDLILITHDHYDHLDFDSIQKLKSKTKQYFVALGAQRHLEDWGIDASKVQEFDWWDDAEFSDIKITFTPTRHFSGRGLRDRAKSLWGGWVLKSPTENVWFSGDGGYSEHFKEIGKRLGPFDFGFMECGQYNEKWQAIHMLPDESVQAAIDAGVQQSMPVHWAGFALALHTWQAPVEDFTKHANEKQISAIYPKIGQLVEHGKAFEHKAWWEEVE